MLIKDYIKTRVEKHRVLSEKLFAETKEMVETPALATQLMKRYAAEVAAKMLQSEIDTAVAKANALDVLFNSEVKKAIKDARRASLPDAVRNREIPADYQLQISNALAFIKMSGRNLTDAEAFEILKPFFNDWGQIYLFEQAILHIFPEMQHNPVGAREKFPNALGGILNIADTHKAVFDEAEMLAEKIFLGEKQSTAFCLVGNVRVEGAIIADGYDQRTTQDRLIELGGIIDKFSTDGLFMIDPAIGRAVEKAIDDNADFIWDGRKPTEQRVADNDNNFIWG